MCWATSVLPGGPACTSMRRTGRLRRESATLSLAETTCAADVAWTLCASRSGVAGAALRICCCPLQQLGAWIPYFAVQQLIRAVPASAHAA